MPRTDIQHPSPVDETRARRLSLALAVALAALVLLPLLGHRPLTDWDEGIYAEIAREMLGSGWHNWLTPHWNGHPWFEKPPLQMWLTAASLRLFGLNAFAARLPSVFSGIALVAVLHAWLLRRFHQCTAWLSTVLLLSAFGFQHAARAGETDTLLSLGCLIALLGLANVAAAPTPLDSVSNPVANPAPPPRAAGNGWYLFWIGWAIALMTKSAASLAVPLTALALALLDPRSLLRFRRSFFLGLLVFVALVLPWHLWMYTHFGRDFLSTYLGLHVLHRAAGAIEGHQTHWWFYLWVLLISAPPFALLYPFAAAAPFRQPALRVLRPLSVFALLEVCLFTAARTRLPHYIAPLYAPLSALTAALIAHWLRSRQPLRRLTPIRLAIAAAALYGLGAAITAHPRRALHSAHLANGFVNPDNRESARLLHRTLREAATIPGPLLVWQQGNIVPLQTDAFYARRLAQQVTLAPPPPGTPRDLYFFSPEPLDSAMAAAQPRLLLLDRSLTPQLPAKYRLTPLANGPTQLLAVIAPRP